MATVVIIVSGGTGPSTGTTEFEITNCLILLFPTSSAQLDRLSRPVVSSGPIATFIRKLNLLFSIHKVSGAGLPAQELRAVRALLEGRACDEAQIKAPDSCRRGPNATGALLRRPDEPLQPRLSSHRCTPHDQAFAASGAGAALSSSDSQNERMTPA